LAAGWIAQSVRVGQEVAMTTSTKPPYVGHRFSPKLISHVVGLYFKFPLSLHMVEEMLAFRGIVVSH
jgi:putative transposase